MDEGCEVWVGRPLWLSDFALQVLRVGLAKIDYWRLAGEIGALDKVKGKVGAAASERKTRKGLGTGFTPN
jgi:hypothetical protein